MEMRVVAHELKCEANYYDAVEDGSKPFEVRRDDRGFQRGDLVKLFRTRDGLYHHNDRLPNGDSKCLIREITYVLTGGQFGIEPGYVVLGLAEIEEMKRAV